MSAEEEMIPLLSLFKPKNRILDPWQKQLPSIFKRLSLKQGMRIIDIPCGQGGVSVPLAKKYKVTVVGYDIFPDYVRYAREYAKENGVADLCEFRSQDIREVVKKKRLYDILLWIGAPHVWGKTKPTISKLRNIVKDSGLIVIADAYIQSSIKRKGVFKDYESFDDCVKGYTSFGDEIIETHDYKDSLWDFDYQRTRKEVVSAFNRAQSKNDKSIIKRYLESLDVFQKEDTTMLGLAIWVLKVNKKSVLSKK